MTGKIIRGIAGFYYVHAEDGLVYECRAKGIFRNRKIRPLVGDNAEISVLGTDPPEGNVDEILARRNELIRPAVANVDQALVVFAAKDPEPNLNPLDRFLVMLCRMDVDVSIVFNKTDLADEETVERFRRIYEPAGYPVLSLSTYTGQGMDRIRDGLRGRTTVLAGPSGVGKSSLTNRLMPEANMETGSVSEKIRRGRHTTRHSELFCLENGTYLMDTPGFSSMYVDEMEPEELKDCFPEFEPFTGGCRFPGCVHMGEKVCGIKTAVEEGKISRSRYENYRLLYTEQKEKRRY